MTKKIIFQGITEDEHLSSVRHVLALPEPTEIIFSVAFMSKGGLQQIQDALRPVAGSTTIIAGIRNGITSAQGLETSISYGCRTLVVDTGSRKVIFHPKIYFARNAAEARLVMGSANLTVGGLRSNIEASISLTLDLTNGEDLELADDLSNKISQMLAEYPDHVFTVENADAVKALLESGRVVDETIVVAPNPAGTSGDRNLDTIPKMTLKTARQRQQLPPQLPAAPPAPQIPVPAAQAQLVLVWESNQLTRRHLTIPTGENSNPTGSMLFGKGALNDIDQRHYFRENVFSALDWRHDAHPRKAHYERAEAHFRLIIRGVDYGVFLLRISHNTLTDTRSYEQHNSMTQLHWGQVRPLIAQEDLLDRIMSIYRNEAAPNTFVIEID